MKAIFSLTYLIAQYGPKQMRRFVVRVKLKIKLTCLFHFEATYDYSSEITARFLETCFVIIAES